MDFLKEVTVFLWAVINQLGWLRHGGYRRGNSVDLLGTQRKGYTAQMGAYSSGPILVGCRFLRHGRNNTTVRRANLSLWKHI
jgi:hypothetical protein